jgi:hypothetical protein
MKCQHEKCACHEDCGYLDIFLKEPKSAETCSYYRSTKKAEKKKIEQENNKQNVTDLEKKKIKKEIRESKW